jgi:hypothetical protein
MDRIADLFTEILEELVMRNISKDAARNGPPNVQFTVRHKCKLIQKFNIEKQNLNVP